MVGSGMANGLGLAWDCPVIAVHHMEGHLLAPMLEDEPPEFPFLALLVSGGHSLLIAVRELGDYVVLGTTLDDAVGEAFDKTAKLLGLGYPGRSRCSRPWRRREMTPAYAFPRPNAQQADAGFQLQRLEDGGDA